MARGFTFIYRVEGSPRIPGVSATYCTHFQELAGERVTEVLPALQSIFLEDLDPSGPV
jgi:hypothetical protein